MNITTKLAITLCIVAMSLISRADQLAYISEDQAIGAIEFLKDHDQVMIYCGCCDGDTPAYFKVEEYNMRHTGYENYYEVVIDAFDEAGNREFHETDLAYLFVNINGEAKAVGQLLGFECDPCVEALLWDSPFAVNTSMDDWGGTWQFSYSELEYEYQLTIDSLACDQLNLCTYRVEGTDRTFYTLLLLAVVSADSIKFYFWDYDKGEYFAENDFDRSKPVLELIREGDAVVTNWYQLPGAENGMVCFERR